MLQRLADRLILCPSREEIPVEHKRRRALAFLQGSLDLWIETVNCPHQRDTEIFVLKFGGAGSRAERQTSHPIDFWSDVRAEIWGVNWPGYGASAGPATLASLPAAGVHVYEELRRVANGRPIVITGNSLGTAVALHVAARFRDMAALLLRNPPPLRQMIVGCHGWRSAWIGAWLVSCQVPRELDSIANARGSDVPALFVTSGRDRTVPPAYQQSVVDAYAGPKRHLILPNADHADAPSEADQQEYGRQLAWLRSRMRQSIAAS
jgi:pimeloyl-ACP methyl ester carboxylesterase